MGTSSQESIATKIGSMLTAALIVYAAGVLVGLLRVDAAPLTRIVVAVLWPLGLVAGIVTGSLLVLATMVLFPRLGAATVLAGVLIWWWSL
jgi:uncharacterized membrane protein YdcZ (DUF606 family)